MMMTLHWHCWVEKKKKSRVSLSPFLMDSFPSLSPFFFKSIHCVFDCLSSVFNWFHSCHAVLLKRRSSSDAEMQGRGRSRYHKDSRENKREWEREKGQSHLRFQWHLCFFNFFFFFWADVRASFVSLRVSAHPTSIHVSVFGLVLSQGGFKLALWSVELEVPRCQLSPKRFRWYQTDRIMSNIHVIWLMFSDMYE